MSNISLAIKDWLDYVLLTQTIFKQMMVKIKIGIALTIQVILAIRQEIEYKHPELMFEKIGRKRQMTSTPNDSDDELDGLRSPKVFKLKIKRPKLPKLKLGLNCSAKVGLNNNQPGPSGDNNAMDDSMDSGILNDAMLTTPNLSPIKKIKI